MGRPKATSPRIKVTVALPRSIHEALVELAEAQGKTMTQVVTDAIHTLVFFDHEIKAGAKLMRRTPEGKLIEVVFL